MAARRNLRQLDGSVADRPGHGEGVRFSGRINRTVRPSRIDVGNGTYVKTGGGLFAGEILVDGPSEPIFAPPNAILTHAGGTAMITNDLRLVGQGSRSNPRSATFYMTGGSLSAHRILLETMGIFNQSSGMVQVASTLLMQDNGSVPSTYYFSGGKLFTSETSISSFYPESSGFGQSGGTHIVTNTLWINGVAIYTFSGGTVRAQPTGISGGSFSVIWRHA